MNLIKWWKSKKNKTKAIYCATITLTIPCIPMILAGRWADVIGISFFYAILIFFALTVWYMANKDVQK